MAPMNPGLVDGLHTAATLTRAGMLRPSRPDRTVRALSAVRRFGLTLAAGYSAAAARYPDAPAICDDDGTITFAQLDASTNALARGLASAGLGEGRTVALMCRNSRGFVEAALACSKLGAHIVLLNTSFAGPQVAEVLAREGAAGIIHDAEFAPTAAEALPDRPAFTTERLGELAASRVTSPLPPPAREGRAIILTSGTTGTPKGANRPAPSSLGPVAAILEAIPLRTRQTTLIAAPLFHAWGYAHLLLGATLASTLVLVRRFEPAAIVRALSTQRAQALIVVPVMLQRMLEVDPAVRRDADLSELRIIAASGSALPGHLAQRVMDAFGDVLYNLYGSTEVAWASIAGPRDLRAAPGTAGRPPRGTIVRIFDEAGHEVAPGESGQIYVGSELLFEGYTGGGDKDRRGGLMATGDLGHIDSDGRLAIDGRDDDMIVSGGENVFPAEVEDLLAGVPGVREVAVIGVPDEEFGQRLKAFVSLAAGAAWSEAELQQHVRENLARYKVPREIVFVEELPRNATGKILKRSLLEPSRAV